MEDFAGKEERNMGLFDKLNEIEKKRDRTNLFDYALWRKYPWIGGLLFGFPLALLACIWMFVCGSLFQNHSADGADKILIVLGLISCGGLSFGFQLFTIPLIYRIKPDFPGKPEDYLAGKKKSARIEWLIVGIAICIGCILVMHME